MVDLGKQLGWDRVELACNFGVNPTWDCNASCKLCMRFLDVLSWKDVDSTVSIDDIRIAGELLRWYGIRTKKIHVTGGEPLLHPKIVDVCSVIAKEWKPESIRIYTNDSISPPEELCVKNIYGVRLSLCRVPLGRSRESFDPSMISPTDLGLRPMFGAVSPCPMAIRCGRAFDAFGFAPCSQSIVIGRVLGIDVHQPFPVVRGFPEVCKHCLNSLPRVKIKKLVWLAKRNRIEYPTKTYRERIDKVRQETIKYRRFQERLCDQENLV